MQPCRTSSCNHRSLRDCYRRSHPLIEFRQFRPADFRTGNFGEARFAALLLAGNPHIRDFVRCLSPWSDGGMGVRTSAARQKSTIWSRTDSGSCSCSISTWMHSTPPSNTATPRTCVPSRSWSADCTSAALSPPQAKARKFGLRSAMASVSAKRKCPDVIFSDICPHGLPHFRHRNRLVVRRFTFRIIPNYLYVMPFPGLCEAADAIL